MKLPPSLQLRTYTIIAADPDNDWRCQQLDVRAISEGEARKAARAELVKVHRDGWEIADVLVA